MILRRGMVIAYSPLLCETIGNKGGDDNFAIGTVLRYDRYTDCYDIDVGYENIQASITSNLVTRDNIRIISPTLGVSI